MRLRLKRILRGTQGEVVAEVAATVGEPVRIVDARDKTILGDEDASGTRFELVFDDEVLGAVIGPSGASTVARLIDHLIAREAEKRHLADETLERYKELTLLYNLSDTLSRVLDVGEVAQTVANEACHHLSARGVVLLAHDRALETLEPIATAGEIAIREPIPLARGGIEARVFETGHAEFVEETTDGDGHPVAMVCAPLRSGESVFGLMQATNRPDGGWSAAELKLLTSIAGNAAAAISHAVLHRNQMRQQTLRNRVERFVTESFIDTVRTRDSRADVGIAVYLDLGDVSRGIGTDLSPEALLNIVDRARALAIRNFLNAGGLLNVSSSDTLVAVFTNDDDFDSAARGAHDAAISVCEVLTASGYTAPGIGLARLDLTSDEALLEGIGAAVELQVAAGGRILADDAISVALGNDFEPTETLLDFSYDSETFEVLE